MLQLSPFHPSLRKYSAKRPVRHHQCRQCCLRDFRFLFLLAINFPPLHVPLYRLFYFFCLGAGTCPRDGILLHIPFSLLREEKRGERFARTKQPVHPLPHNQPPSFPPPPPFQPWSNYKGVWRDIIRPISHGADT